MPSVIGWADFRGAAEQGLGLAAGVTIDGCFVMALDGFQFGVQSRNIPRDVWLNANGVNPRAAIPERVDLETVVGVADNFSRRNNRHLVPRTLCRLLLP